MYHTIEITPTPRGGSPLAGRQGQHLLAAVVTALIQRGNLMVDRSSPDTINFMVSGDADDVAARVHATTRDKEQIARWLNVESTHIDDFESEGGP